MKAKPILLLFVVSAVLFSVFPLFGQTPEEGWTRIGVLYTGNITALAVSPSYEIDQTLYIGVSGAGLLRSLNRGEDWEQCDGIPCGETVTGIALPRDYRSGFSMPSFAVTAEGNFYRSDNDFNGISDSHIFMDKLGTATVPCTAIVVGSSDANPSFDGNVYVGTWGYGVWHLPPIGGSWTNISPTTLNLDYCRSLDLTNQASQVLFASSQSTFQTIFMYNGSNEWTGLNPPTLEAADVLTIHSAWANPGRMWIGTADRGMWLSVEGGYDWSPACDGTTGTVGFQVQAIRECPSGDGELWEGRSDGLRSSWDLGSNCSDASPRSQVNVIGFAPAYHGAGSYCEAFVGTGEALYRVTCSAGTSSKGPIVVDGTALAMANRGRGAFMGTLTHGLFKSVDNSTMIDFNNFPNGQRPQVVAVCLDPLYDEFGAECSDATTLFVAANFPDSPQDNGVYKSVNAGNSWTKLTGGQWPTEEIRTRDLAISPAYTESGQDHTLYAAVTGAFGGRLYRWDGSAWVRVAQDNVFTDISVVAVPPRFDISATCVFGTIPIELPGLPCKTVFLSATNSGVKSLWYCLNALDSTSFFTKITDTSGTGCPGGPTCPEDITGIAFPSNFGYNADASLRVVISSSTKGVLTSHGEVGFDVSPWVKWDSWVSLNSGLPINAAGGIDVNDIAADPDWIDDDFSPVEASLNCAVATGSSANPKDYGPYHTDNGGASWSLVEPMGHALSVAFETRNPLETSHILTMAGFLRDPVPSYLTPPVGSYFSENEGVSYSELGNFLLPTDVYSTVAHERNPNILFASSPSMGIFLSRDKGETFTPYNLGKPPDGPCYLENGYGITILADRRGANLDALYVATKSGIKSRYIYYDPSGAGTIHLFEEDVGTANGWRHSTLFGGGNTTGAWERLEVLPLTGSTFPVWATSSTQGFAALPAGAFEGWIFQNGGLTSPPALDFRAGYDGGSSSVETLYDGSIVEGIVQQGAWRYYKIDVPYHTGSLQVDMQDMDGSGSQDPDLYVRSGAVPSESVYDYISAGLGNETVCVTSLLSEDFEGSWGPYGDVPPAGWTIEDNGDEDPKTWNTNDWYNVENPESAYGNSAYIYYYPVETTNDNLISPAFTIPASQTTATLEFDHLFRNYATGEHAYVLFRSDTHTTWVQLADYTSTTGSVMTHISLDLTAYMGETNCQICFRYYAYNGWDWYVDNVRVYARNPAVPYRQTLTPGEWYIGVRGYAAANNAFTLTANLNTGCVQSLSGQDPKKESKGESIPDPKAPIASSTWGTVNGSGVYRGTGTISIAESGQEPSAITWALRNGSTYPLTNYNTRTIIQLPDLTLITGCDASNSTGDDGIWYSPAGNEGLTTWHQASQIAGISDTSKNFVDVIRSSNGDVLIAADGSASGSGTDTNIGGVWLSGDRGKNWMKLSQGFSSVSQELSDIVADSGVPPSYYSSTSETGLWTRTITASPYPTITSISPGTGSTSGSTSVTITGTGFADSCPTGSGSDCPSATPILIFGDNNGTTAYEVTASWSSSTTLTALTPEHPLGAVIVKVRNPDTRESTAGVAYTYAVTCDPPSGMANNLAADADPCADTGVNVSWSDPSDWGDGGSGIRTFDVLRDGGALAMGLSWGLHAYNDTTGTNGVAYTYSVTANNGCGESLTTSGESAADVLCVPPEVADGTYPNIQSWSGDIQNWPATERASGYYLYRVLRSELPNLDGGGALSLCKWDLSGGTNTSYDCSGDDAGSAESRIYYYIVTGYNESGEGGAGNGTGFTRTLSAGVCP